jgi:hypothetical protein
VAENATAVTTVVGTVDGAATLTYSIVAGGDGDKFAINPTTGALTFVAAPNFEIPTDSNTNNVYDVTVQVSDGTATDTQAIAVTVTNVNEAPVITSNGGAATAAVNVAENTTAVTTVTSTDVDAADGKTFSITGGADQLLFAIDAGTGALTFVSGRDFETMTDVGANGVYDVQVTVTDTAGLTDVQDIAVTVTDVNDNTPVITSNGGASTAAVNVAENTMAVTTVTSTDADAGATLTYSLAGGADIAKFNINPTTGALTFVAAPDFEAPTDSNTNNVYDVTVQVSDGTTTDTQAIAVTVTNINDNTPVITSNGGGATAAVSVAENTTAVTTVTATDADAGATLSYSITGGADAARFAISSTGVLTFVAAPNFEAPTDAGIDNVYDVTVQVSDGTTTDTQAIAVTVTNVDDTAAAPTLDLATTSDSGISTTDNVTNDTTPTFDVTGENGATVTLFNDANSNGAVDGGETLGSVTLSGTTTGTITSIALAEGVYNNLKVIQTDAFSNTSAASVAHAPVAIDTTAPTESGASFTETVSSTESISFSYSEAVIASSTAGLTLHKNPNLNDGQGGWSSPTVITPTGVSGTGTSTLTLTTNIELISTDVVRASYSPDWGGTVADLAGNLLASGEVWFGGSGASIIDLSNYGSNLPITIRGNGGSDQLTGTSASDVIIDGGGADILTGGRGADIIRLVENGVDRSYAKDTVVIGLGESTVNGWDTIKGSGTSPAGTGFDISSTTAGNHDVLSLQSKVIAANTVSDVDGTDVGAIAKHSISAGIVTFKNTAGTVIDINQSNSTDAGTYLSTNINSPGTTVAFKIDGDNNGTVDSLVVFQDNGTIPLSNNYVVPDTVVVLSGLIGVASATLGTTAGANVVQLVDTTPPEPTGFALTTDGFAINTAENAFATTSLAMSMQKNGTDTIFTNPTVDGSGTTTLSAHYSGLSLAATDWVLMSFAGTNATNSISDAGGNFLTGGDTWAEGGSGNNTINLTALGLTAGYGLSGNAGNDILTGSSGNDWISGGTGADTITGGGGQDDFDFEQGDSPARTDMNLGGDGVLNNGDTFIFASGVDRITDLASGEGFNLNSLHHDLSGLSGVGWMGAQSETPATSVQPSNGLATDQGFFLIQGVYNGTTTFTANSAGADTLVMYDGDSSAGVTQTGIVLSGVTLAQLQAYTGNNWISHI